MNSINKNARKRTRYNAHILLPVMIPRSRIPNFQRMKSWDKNGYAEVAEQIKIFNADVFIKYNIRYRNCMY